MKKLLIALSLLLTVSCNATTPPFQVHLVEKNVYRGPRPPSLEALKAQIPNLKYVIDLEDHWYEDFHNDLYKQERQHASDYGVVEMDRPLSDFAPPDSVALQLIASELNQYNKEGAVYIHCLYGDDRTGMSVAAYRILIDKRSVDQAKAEMYTMGFHRFPYFYWVPVLSELQ